MEYTGPTSRSSQEIQDEQKEKPLEEPSRDSLEVQVGEDLSGNQLSSLQDDPQRSPFLQALRPAARSALYYGTIGTATSAIGAALPSGIGYQALGGAIGGGLSGLGATYAATLFDQYYKQHVEAGGRTIGQYLASGARTVGSRAQGLAQNYIVPGARYIGSQAQQVAQNYLVEPVRTRLPRERRELDLEQGSMPPLSRRESFS